MHRNLGCYLVAVALGAALAWEHNRRREAEARAQAWPVDAELDEELRQLAVMAVGSADAVCQRGKFLLNDR